MKRTADDDGDDSVRSRVTAGVRYFLVGGVICAVLLLVIHQATTAVPYWGGARPVLVEMIAGIGGIVAFMGLVQLLIAWILKRRGHQ